MLQPFKRLRWEGDEDDGCGCPPRGHHPAWEIAGAVLGGLAAGAAPILAKVVVMKCFPELLEAEYEEEEKEDE